MLEDYLLTTHSSLSLYSLQDEYEDTRFDEDDEPKAEPVSKGEENSEEAADEQYSDVDYSEDEKQFEELKAQIYGDPDEEDDYDEDFEEEAVPEKKPEPVHESKSAPKSAPVVKQQETEQPKEAKVPENKGVIKAPQKASEKLDVKKETEAKSPEKEAAKVDEITQNYLKMLKTGKLQASAKKEENSNQRPPPREASVEGDRREIDRPQSVHEADLRRLEEGSEMDLVPLQLKSRGEVEETHNPKQGNSSKPKAALATSAHNKILVPGPGYYSTSRDRFGRNSAVFDQERPSSAGCLGFGTSGRPEHFIVNKDGSPGPVHLPKYAFDSTKQGPRNYSLGKRIQEYLPSNHSIWNPSPLQYPQAASLRPDGTFADSRGALIHAFPKSKKLSTSVESLAGMVFISEEHSRIDNSGIFSPSKIYDQAVDAVRPSSPCITMAPRFKWGGIFYTSSRSQTPGPYVSSSEGAAINRRGLTTFGSGPRTSIGNAPRDFSPERSLNQSPYISKEHCYHANQLLFSAPVGSYEIQGIEREKVKSPTLHSGPADRFYDRLEPGRVG